MINRHQLQAMIDFVEQKGLNETTLGELRQQYEGLHFTWCLDDDINFEHPVAEHQEFNVFLVDSRDHCSTLTKDAETASGVVFAEILED
ncbi:MAG: hypothetical protein CMI02_16640 [Oceanospirillaceae bacterium]|nr:hypothetical protein [Oceanospirillaceae bacterium]MBT13649.1 hypothetical protein [Oceanospirillaceae bacterium]|tara:strand:+ start:57975 stop:58241 length:267 start_codon:yes stop_codon:yes gene_type:complete